MATNLEANKNHKVEVFLYEKNNPTHKKAFADLNIEWIEKFFELEDVDLELFSSPEKHILNKGGYILFAKIDDEIVGTVGLKKMDDICFELIKLAVTEKYQGYKIGKILMEKLIELAKDLKLKRIFLVSNNNLHAALNLYKKFNFSDCEGVQTSKYARGNVFMELYL